MDWLRKQLKTDARRFLYSRRAETVAATLLALALTGFCLFAVFLLEYVLGITDGSTLLTLPSIPAEFWATGEAFRRPEAYVLGAGVALGLLLVSPLRAGRARWYLENSRGNALPAALPFCGLRVYLRALYVSLYDVLLRLVSVLPVLWLIWFGRLQIQAGAAHLGWSELTRRLLLLALWLAAAFFIMLWLWFIQRWALLPYLALERPELGLRGLLRLSCSATKGFRFELLYARLSFLGWGVLCVFLLPFLYVFPYYEQTMALYARYLLERADRERGENDMDENSSVLNNGCTAAESGTKPDRTSENPVDGQNKA